MSEIAGGVNYPAYLSYVLRHKWYVFVECLKMGLVFRGVVHDLSKFLPGEFLPYAAFFHGPKKPSMGEKGYFKPTETGNRPFDFAWLLHQKRNDHHWQWWVLPKDDGGNKVLEMSMEARLEMVADWRGAGKAQGKPDTLAWYKENASRMQLGPYTRAWIEHVLGLTSYGVPSWISQSGWWKPKEVERPDHLAESGEDGINWFDDFYFFTAYPLYVRRKMLREDPAFEMGEPDEQLYAGLFWAINRMFLPDRWTPEDVENEGIGKKLDRARADARAQRESERAEVSA